MLKYIFTFILYIIIFLLFINKYYEFIILYILIPISKQNKYNEFDYYLYKNIDCLLFNNKQNFNIFPVFEINFDIKNITYIIYYLIFIYIIIYLIPVILLQIYMFIKSSLLKHENNLIIKFIIYYFIIFISITTFNNNIIMYNLVNVLFNSYQKINLFVFDLNINLHEYLLFYIFILFLNYVWILIVINSLVYNINNNNIILLLVLLLILVSPVNIMIYIIEIAYFIISYIIIKTIFIIKYYSKRIPSKYK